MLGGAGISNRRRGCDAGGGAFILGRCPAAGPVRAIASALAGYATYGICSIDCVGRPDKTLLILSGEIKTPPMSAEARREAGFLLRSLQRGESLGLPHSRPMPVIGPRCHELRIIDAQRTWRVIYRTDQAEILVVDVFAKTTRTTPTRVIENCRRRLGDWDSDED